MAPCPTVYLAGPDVFLPDAVEVGRKTVALCAEYGFIGLNPADTGEASAGSGTAAAIYARNIALLRQADLGIFNLSPFRGPGADAGTAFELGYLVARGVPVFGYTTALVDYRERVAGGRFVPERGCWVDEAGQMIEDFGGADNLMLDEAVRFGGGRIARAEDGIAGLEACLVLAANLLTSKAGRVQP